MEKFEVLAPAGDKECFYTAIDAGADAIYFGLNKFNARMKADNICLENLSELVDYAHIKGVRCYVTINTLLSDSEVRELVGLVGECIRCGVDAFIVQDLGVISVLRKVYPNIILHGSTQMGVHNVRGARVARDLGLSRVVLSREVTLQDIKEIKENVDIELEVFVQGAMCVAFSGNCYLSSLKNGASGNRGLCKQLCRLPFTLSNNKKTTSGYMLSPRDNCMLEYMRDLCKIGVISFKIEGRLRRAGYVSTATRIYRECVDSIVKDQPFNLVNSKRELKKVFSRGEFIPGYFESKGIIDPENNNHMGERIGVVAKVERFKDLYKVHIETNADLHLGDGLKVVGKETVSLGVGNIEVLGKNTIVYTKNKAEVGNAVYRVLDSVFESARQDKSRIRKIDATINVVAGEPISIIAKTGEFEWEYVGDVVSPAKSRPITRDDIIKQFSKCGDGFELGDVNIHIDGEPFMPISQINECRRMVIDRLKQKILDSYKIDFVKNNIDLLQENAAETNSLDSCMSIDDLANLAIVDEGIELDKLAERYSALILSPTVYSKEVVERFFNRYKKLFDVPMLLNLPIIALGEDLPILDKIVEFAIDNKIILIANNIYALDYVRKGAMVFVGSNMNVTNNYCYNKLKSMGVKEIVSSIEKWTSPVSNTYRMCNGRRVLMTFNHCPNVTLNNNDCSHCSHCGDLILKSNNVNYSIRRYRIRNCYFELVDNVIENRSSKYSIDDLRGIYV